MPATLHARVYGQIERALDALERSGDLPAGLARTGLTLETPYSAAHGDLSTNAAMVLAKDAGVAPRQLAGSAPRTSLRLHALFFRGRFAGANE